MVTQSTVFQSPDPNLILTGNGYEHGQGNCFWVA